MEGQRERRVKCGRIPSETGGLAQLAGMQEMSTKSIYYQRDNSH